MLTYVIVLGEKMLVRCTPGLRLPCTN